MDMCVEIKIKDFELYIEKSWGLSNVVISKILQENGERKVYLVESQEGTFVLKVFNPELTLNEITSYIDVLVFLEKKDLGFLPKIMKLLDGSTFTKIQGRYIYLMEYIEGVKLSENIFDEYALGVKLAKLHQVDGYSQNSGIDVQERVNNMISRFEKFKFKAEYDSIVKSLPDFSKLKQSFIHTDICPKNALKSINGEMFIIDFDDAGIGSTFIDLGYPLITQFVGYEDKKDGTGNVEFFYKYELAKAFYDGYFSILQMSNNDKKFIFDGAVFMQLMYMPVYGEEHVPFLWRQLKYAIKNKALLMKVLGIE